MSFGRKLKGFADFGGEIGIVRDEDIWQMILGHSSFIDRLSGRKMVQMTIWSQVILQSKKDSPARRFIEQPNWKFYGKGGFFSFSWDSDLPDSKRPNM